MRALEIKGDLPQHLTPEYTPTIQANDLTEPEFQYLRRTELKCAGAGQLAVAAQFSYAALMRALGTFTIDRLALAVVERIVITNTSAGGLNFFLYFDQLGTPVVTPAPTVDVFPRDDRAGSGTLQTTQGLFVQVVGASATDRSLNYGHKLTYAVPASSSLSIEGPFILTGRGDPTGGVANPLTYLVVQTAALNTNLNVNFFWRERLLLPSEL